jgi:hypothetical protein
MMKLDNYVALQGDDFEALEDFDRLGLFLG